MSYYKHLTEDERNDIENFLNFGKSFSKIALLIDKDRTTIAKEIKRYRTKCIPKSNSRFSQRNFCIYSSRCGKENCTSDKTCYRERICEKLTKPPYVCNACEFKSHCREIKYKYFANTAHKAYLGNLSNSRIGLNITEDELAIIDKTISPLLLEQNQPINHIYTYNKDILKFSKTTFYNYIDKNAFTFRNINLPRKVKLKPRATNSEPKTKKDNSCRINRTYIDYQKYLTTHPNANIVQMDTVEGVKGGKVFLTLLFVKNNLMLIYLMDNKDTECVGQVFEYLKETIGIENYKKYFEIVLTDNGSEFTKPYDIELDYKTGEIISNLFYCDPAASWQKGNIEKNHEFIRYVLPKGSSFDNLTQKDADLLMNHINNTRRTILDGKSPYELALHMDFLEKLNLYSISPEDVNLSKRLLK